MERLKGLVAEGSSIFVTCLCWFSPQHCDYIAKILAVIIGTVTLFFITLPRAWPNIKKIMKKGN